MTQQVYLPVHMTEVTIQGCTWPIQNIRAKGDYAVFADDSSLILITIVWKGLIYNFRPEKFPTCRRGRGGDERDCHGFLKKNEISIKSFITFRQNFPNFAMFKFGRNIIHTRDKAYKDSIKQSRKTKPHGPSREISRNFGITFMKFQLKSQLGVGLLSPWKSNYDLLICPCCLGIVLPTFI